MIIPDVNVWIDSMRAQAPNHDATRRLLAEAIAGAESVGISELIFSAVVRILTNQRVLAEPQPLEAVLDALQVWRDAPGTIVVRPGSRHWHVFTELCRATGATGNQVPDAYHAALAIEHGATFVSADRAFANFPGLKYRHPAK